QARPQLFTRRVGIAESIENVCTCRVVLRCERVTDQQYACGSGPTTRTGKLADGDVVRASEAGLASRVVRGEGHAVGAGCGIDVVRVLRHGRRAVTEAPQPTRR